MPHNLNHMTARMPASCAYLKIQMASGRKVTCDAKHIQEEQEKFLDQDPEEHN